MYFTPLQKKTTTKNTFHASKYAHILKTLHIHCIQLDTNPPNNVSFYVTTHSEPLLIIVLVQLTCQPFTNLHTLKYSNILSTPTSLPRPLNHKIHTQDLSNTHTHWFAWRCPLWLHSRCSPHFCKQTEPTRTQTAGMPGTTERN